VRVPEHLGWWRERPGGPEWLEQLPGLVDELAEAWSLEVSGTLSGGRVALVLRVSREGEPAVLKLNFPEPESEHEAMALERWGGVGAVRVLEHDARRSALLLEWCEPGTSLWEVEDDEEATRIAAAVLRRLRRPVADGDPFATLSAQAERWAAELPRDWAAAGKPFARPLLDAAVAACRELGMDTVPPVLLHQDLQGSNVLRSERGWLAVDPKPLAGDPAFDAASLLRDRRWLLGSGGDEARLARRLDVLAEVLELDRERLQRWGVVHALAWGVSGTAVEADMVRCAEVLHRA
jgi:streptomycin 6-kinase